MLSEHCRWQLTGAVAHVQLFTYLVIPEPALNLSFTYKKTSNFSNKRIQLMVLAKST